MRVWGRELNNVEKWDREKESRRPALELSRCDNNVSRWQVERSEIADRE